MCVSIVIHCKAETVQPLQCVLDETLHMWQSRIEIKTYATRKFSENGAERFVTECSGSGAPCL